MEKVTKYAVTEYKLLLPPRPNWGTRVYLVLTTYGSPHDVTEEEVRAMQDALDKLGASHGSAQNPEADKLR